MSAAVERLGDVEQFQSVWAEDGWQGHTEAPLQMVSTLVELSSTTVAERLQGGVLCAS